MTSRSRGTRSGTRAGARVRRALLAALVTASVAVPVSGAAGPAAVPAPVPAALGPLRAATSAALDERYAAVRAGVRAAERMAADHGDRVTGSGPPGSEPWRSRTAGSCPSTAVTAAAPWRSSAICRGPSGSLYWSPARGVGLDAYWRLRRDAVALERELGGRSAVVAWLGYETPATVSPGALTPGRADEAAPGLRAFVAELGRLRPAARTSLLCHSYGSVVCARAAFGLEVADIVLYGSPGTGADSVPALNTRATVWAGRGGDDWIARVPHMRLELPFATVGFGTDPLSPEFGAEIFAAGDGGHSDYLKPGSQSLRSITRIVSGETA